ncbi:MAG: segregation/condensation protein A, partial [Proteobacteria bacterium]|nr:segregation/condensation protein A [Pseudomonadota bacterium]
MANLTLITSNSDDRYHVRLPAFEGPMDLLYHLIRKNEVDIYDIPIALITDQYLAYIEMMKAMNVDLAGEFLVMAATLMHIKSRMLLPVHSEEEDEDPRMEIIRPLAEYLQIRDAADLIADRELLGESVFAREPEPPPPRKPEEENIAANIFDLMDAFSRLLARAGGTHQVFMDAEGLSVRERILELTDLLERRQTLTFSELFSPDAGRTEIITTFLAVLEMMKMNLIHVVQHIQSGAIRIFHG